MTHDAGGDVQSAVKFAPGWDQSEQTNFWSKEVRRCACRSTCGERGASCCWPSCSFEACPLPRTTHHRELPPASEATLGGSCPSRGSWRWAFQLRTLVVDCADAGVSDELATSPDSGLELSLDPEASGCGRHWRQRFDRYDCCCLSVAWSPAFLSSLAKASQPAAESSPESAD